MQITNPTTKMAVWISYRIIFNMTYTSVLGQAKTASPFRFSSHTAHHSVLNFPWKNRYKWIPYSTGAPHLCETATNDFIDTLAIKAWNNLRANLMIFAIQKYSNLVKRKKRHTALKWGFPRDVSHPQSPLALKFHDSDSQFGYIHHKILPALFYPPPSPVPFLVIH